MILPPSSPIQACPLPHKVQPTATFSPAPAHPHAILHCSASGGRKTGDSRIRAVVNGPSSLALHSCRQKEKEKERKKEREREREREREPVTCSGMKWCQSIACITPTFLLPFIPRVLFSFSVLIFPSSFFSLTTIFFPSYLPIVSFITPSFLHFNHFLKTTLFLLVILFLSIPITPLSLLPSSTSLLSSLLLSSRSPSLHWAWSRGHWGVKLTCRVPCDADLQLLPLTLPPFLPLTLPPFLLLTLPLFLPLSLFPSLLYTLTLSFPSLILKLYHTFFFSSSPAHLRHLEFSLQISASIPWKRRRKKYIQDWNISGVKLHCCCYWLTLLRSESCLHSVL